MRRFISDGSYRILWVGAALAFNMLCEGAITVLVESGQTIDANNSLTFESFSTPNLSKYGEIAFAANFEELDGASASSEFEGVLLHTTSGLTLTNLSGQSAEKPGDPYRFLSFGQPSITELGVAMFRAIPEGEDSWRQWEQSIWVSWVVSDGETTYPQTSILAKVWDKATADYFGEPAESGGKYEYLSNPIPTQPRTFAFLADLQDGPLTDETGVWYQPARGPEEWYIPRPELVALTSQALPGSSLILERIESYTPINSDQGVLVAKIAQGNGIDNTNDLGLWRTTRGNNAELLARTGNLDADSDAAFASFGTPSTNSGGEVTFWGSVVNETGSEGIYLFANSTISQVASSEVDLPTDSGTLDFESFFDPIIAKDGRVVVLGKLDTESSELAYALVARSGDGSWKLLARTGDQAPGTFAGTAFGSLSSIHLNDAGHVAFIASLTGEGDLVSDTSDSGLWAQDASGVLTAVVREGDNVLSPDGTLRTLAAFEIGGFNTEGQLALHATFTNDGSAIASATAMQPGPPVIASQPASIQTYVGETVILSILAFGQGPFRYQWSKDGTPIDGRNEANLKLIDVTDLDDGDYTALVTSPFGEVLSQPASLTVNALPDVPVFVEQPLKIDSFLGSMTEIAPRVLASQFISYQWFKDGEALSGATSGTLLVVRTQRDNEGTYHLVATTDAGSAQSDGIRIRVTDRRIINLSTRALVGTGANVLIAGFVVEGEEEKQVLIRGVGPGLDQFNVPGTLQRPIIELRDNANELVAENRGWTTGDGNAEAIQAASLTVGAFDLPEHSEDAAMVRTLQPGRYTVILHGEAGETGVGLVEIYEIEENLARLVNISSRAYVGNGSDVLIPGIVVVGDLPSRILFRAVGPGLAQLDVAGGLAEPVIELIHQDKPEEIVAFNGGWSNSTKILEASNSVGAFALQPGSQDAALIATLEPGVYTVRVSGLDGTTGVALVEAYALP